MRVGTETEFADIHLAFTVFSLLLTSADSPMRLNQMGGANDSMINMAGAGATSYGGAPQPGYAMAPSSSRASYNTLEMAGEQPMGHAASGGYHDQGVSPEFPVMVVAARGDSELTPTFTLSCTTAFLQMPTHYSDGGGYDNINPLGPNQHGGSSQGGLYDPPMRR